MQLAVAMPASDYHRRICSFKRNNFLPLPSSLPYTK